MGEWGPLKTISANNGPGFELQAIGSRDRHDLSTESQYPWHEK